MKKKILINCLVFVLALVFFTFLLFPYSKVTEYYVLKAASNAGININIGTTKASIFGAEFLNVTIDDQKANKIQIGYSPLSIFTKSFFAKVESKAVTGTGSFKKGETKMDMLLSLAEFPEARKIGVDGDVALSLNLVGEKGNGNIRSSRLVIPTDFGSIPLTNLAGNLLIEKNIVVVSELKSDGTTKLNLKGNLRINKQNIEKSLISLAGTLDVAGMEKEIAIVGALGSPQISVK